MAKTRVNEVESHVRLADRVLLCYLSASEHFKELGDVVSIPHSGFLWGVEGPEDGGCFTLREAR